MEIPNKKELKEYERWHKAPPSLQQHDIEDTKEHPLSEQLIPGNPTNWRLEGNELCYDTQFGPMRERIPTDWIMTGVDKNGLPIMKKVV